MARAVLHVVAQMNRGGVETWLMQVLRNLDPSRVRMEFLVTRAAPGHYDDEIRKLGSALIPCESPASPARFASRFLAILRERGPFDVVHSHVHHFSGLILTLSRQAGVPIRIAHSHTDTRHVDSQAGFRRRLYLAGMKAAMRRYATHGLAVSAQSAESLFGPNWTDDDRWRIVRCGLDFAAFRRTSEGSAARSVLGIPPDAIVLGHVGRFDANKNQTLLVDVVAAGLRRDPRAFLLLVGDGPLRGSVEARAASLGIRHRVVFAGIQQDIPRMLSTCNAFVFPSLVEGLPLAVLEAQAAGLRIVLSDRVTREVVVLPELFTWRSPTDSVESWADAALSATRCARVHDPVAALEQSEFSMARSLGELVRVYDPEPERCGRRRSE